MKKYSVYPYNGKYPVVGENVFIADGVRLIGEITIGDNSSVWYNSVIRADINHVRIGKFTNIQDGSVLHVNSDNFPLIVGDHVTVGHNANLHACTIEDFSLIGIGAVVLDGALVEKYSLVAAGSVVTPGTVIKSGFMYAGAPAKLIRELSEKELAYFEKSAYHYFEIAKESEKSIFNHQKMESQ